MVHYEQRDLRGAYHKADFDYKMSNIFIFEYTVIVPIIVGLFFKSWYAGIWSFLILIVIAPIKIVGLFWRLFLQLCGSLLVGQSATP
ncbi:Uncharacterised protein [Moraxella caprae]|uniref:Uncharacterized protein n=1 Tax=Moraxella caprae TaxID=90240 RepID=A0A378QCJ6_9GAMM|nr:Uncharacterised protein [Moraxella caprae]